jgi:hypothetical protein
MDVLLDALGYQARQPHQEDVSTSSTDAHKELLASSALVNTGSATAITVDGDGVVAVIGHLPGRAETWEAGPAKAPAADEDPTVRPHR